LRKQVFWFVAPCGWVIASRRFEERHCLHLQVYVSVNWLITLKKVVHYFESAGRNYPTTRRKSPGDLVLQQSRGENESLTSRYIQSWHFLHWRLTIRLRGSLCSTELLVTLCSFYQVVSTDLNYVTFVRHKACFELVQYVQVLYKKTFRTGSVATFISSLTTFDMFTTNFASLIVIKPEYLSLIKWHAVAMFLLFILQETACTLRSCTYVTWYMMTGKF
jgi:hypothetical protein